MDPDHPEAPFVRAPIVPAGGRFDGTLAFRGAAEVEGTVVGPVTGEGTLWIGPEACVLGEVEVDELVVAGKLEGDVRARRRLELERGATVRGTLEAPRFAMAEGAVMEGLCRSGEDR